MKSRRMMTLGATTAAIGLLSLPLAGVGGSTSLESSLMTGDVARSHYSQPLQFNDVDVDGLMSAEVVSNDRSTVGRIDELLISASGELTGAIVAVDGIFGFGTRSVSVGFSQLRVEERPGDGIVVYALLSADDLQDLPTFDG